MSSSRYPAVREVMHSGVLTIDPDEPLLVAADTMSSHGVSALVVVDDDEEVEGILTERDVLVALSRAKGDITSGRAGDAMTQPVVTIPPHVPADQALRAMSHRGIDKLPVAFEGRAVGMVTERDILDHLPNLAPVARSLDTQVSTVSTDWVRLVGRCQGCGAMGHDLREVDDGFFCHRCSGGLRSRTTPNAGTAWKD